MALKGGSPFNEEELITQDDAKPVAAQKSLFNRFTSGVKKTAGIKDKVLRSIKFTTKPFNKLDKTT